MPRFVLNEQNKKNSYGFKILTSGISLERFNDNPVMLDGHNPSNLSVIGKWIQIKTSNGTLSADTDFDTEDPNANTIAGKVDRGVIKGCSMGISFNKKDLTYENGELTLSKCELMEASIVAIPSNSKALRLYADGTLLDESAIKTLCLSIENQSKEFKNDNMKKIQLSVAVLIVLGFTGTATEVSPEEIETAVLGLQKKLELSEEKLSAYVEKETTRKKKEVTDMVDLAVKQGQITADKRQSFIDLANTNFELAKSTLSAIPVKQSFSTDINTPAGTSKVSTMDEFQKLSTQEQLAFKDANPLMYATILKSI